MIDSSRYIDPVWPGWETVRLIGRGSYGAVYEIQRDVFGETEKAAMKVISIPQSTSESDELRGAGYDGQSITDTFREHLKSIIAEYSIMRKLNGHSNVVSCDDVRYIQHTDGFGWDIFIKMELLTPLVQALGKDIPDEQVIRIGRDICRALALCRKFNIVHRDIKPANIFVSSTGDCKLGDFGVARTMEKTSGASKVGTYEYMAPEVYHGAPYGAGADIYSLGMVLYWLLNDRRGPFLAPPPALPTASEKERARERRFGGEPLPPPAHGSERLKRIVLKACAYDPKDRYQTADDLLSDLEAPGNFSQTALAPSSAGADPGTVTIAGASPTSRPFPARKWLAAAAAGVVLLVAVLALTRSLSSPSDAAPSPAPEVAALSEASEPEAAGLSEAPESEAAGLSKAPEPDPAPEPTPLPTAGVSTDGAKLKNIVYDESGNILSLAEKTGNKWIKWTYVYDAQGEFRYRKKNIGGVSGKLGKSVPGTGSASFILSSPVEDCVGFTLGYQVTYMKKGNDCTGKRDVYIRVDSSQWEKIGAYDYPKAKAYVSKAFELAEPCRLEAVASPRRKENKSHFQFQYTLTDVWVADYEYVAPVPAS